MKLPSLLVEFNDCIVYNTVLYWIQYCRFSYVWIKPSNSMSRVLSNNQKANTTAMRNVVIDYRARLVVIRGRSKFNRTLVWTLIEIFFMFCKAGKSSRNFMLTETFWGLCFVHLINITWWMYSKTTTWNHLEIDIK